MVAPNVDAIACPRCDGTSTIALSDGTLLCLSCRMEWDPHDPPAPRVPLDVPPLVTADSILGPPADLDNDTSSRSWLDAERAAASDDRFAPDDDAQAWIDNAAGTQLVLDGGQVVTVVEIVDEDWVRVKMGDDREEVVSFGDVVRSVTVPADRTTAVDDVPDDALRILTAVGGLLHATAQVARACNVSMEIVANILDTYRDYDVPADADLLPIVLGDSVAALQMLAAAFGLPPDLIAQFVSVEPTDATTAGSETST